jgi:hypothetical protein
MNTFKKYCPNVFVAECTEQHEKGEIITLETKYGKEVENEVHNFLGKTKEGKFLYSITRTDGTNSQTKAISKAEKLEGYADNSEKRSMAYYEASKEGKDFLVLGEPIKIGHHSERRHRKLIERNWERMGKSIVESDKAKEYERKAEYWAERANKIDLSLPDCLEFFEFKLSEAKKNHKFLIDNPDKRPHSMSLQYSNKEIKDLIEKVELAIKLWGNEEEIAQLMKEKELETKSKLPKKQLDLVEKCNGFFAFNTDQLKEGFSNLIKLGIIQEGDKILHVGKGLYIPKSSKDLYENYSK